jgi:hypothetical protein
LRRHTENRENRNKSLASSHENVHKIKKCASCS